MSPFGSFASRSRKETSTSFNWERVLLAAFLLAVTWGRAAAGEAQPGSCELRHPMTDAWFTGPMLANTAATAPRGHSLVEPYLYDVTTQGAFAANGKLHSAPHANSYGSLTYIIYGITDTLAFGVIPTAGYTAPSHGPSSAGPGMGDVTLISETAPAMPRARAPGRRVRSSSRRCTFGFRIAASCACA